MENSKVITLLKTFTKKEMHGFDRFLRSPYFTEGKNIRHKILYKYFTELNQLYPDFSDNKLNKEFIFAKLYPGTIYNDGLMRKLNSDLTKLAEKYLSQAEFDKDEFKKMEYLINNLSPRKLDKLFLKRADECYKLLDNDRFNLYYYFNKQLIDILVNNFSVYRQDLLGNYNFQKEADNFFLYFISRALEIYRNISIDTSFININYKPHFMKEVLNYVERNPVLLEENPLIAIHFYELMVNISIDEDNYFTLKKLKTDYENNLDIFGRYNIYANLSSFCLRMIQDGKQEYRKELLLLDIEILKKNIYGISDYISYIYFGATVRNAAKLKELNWAYKFIDAYKHKLDPRHKNFALNYAYSEIFIEQKNYEKALECLSKISIEYSREKQVVKNMILKIYYETSSYENALSLIDSSMHFLGDDKQIPEGRKSSSLKFLKFTNQLIKLRLNHKHEKLLWLKEDISSSGFFVNKDWLLEKIEELKF